MVRAAVVGVVATEVAAVVAEAAIAAVVVAGMVAVVAVSPEAARAAPAAHVAHLGVDFLTDFPTDALKRKDALDALNIPKLGILTAKFIGFSSISEKLGP